MELLVQNTTVAITTGDFALQAVDALILPTNTFLWFSSSDAEGLKRRGGEALESEALALGPIALGEAVTTPAGRLKAKWLIHAAAWGQDLMPRKLTVRQALLAGLRQAVERQCASAALPVAGAGMGDFNLSAAVEATFFTVVEHCLQSTSLTALWLVAKSRVEADLLNRMLTAAKSAGPPTTLDPFA